MITPAITSFGPTTGVLKTQVCLVNFQNDTRAPTDHAAVDATLQIINAQLLEQSYGRTSLTWDIFGWWTLPMDATCEMGFVGPVLWQLQLANSNPSLYDRFVIVLPYRDCGGVSGETHIGDRVIWLNGAFDPLLHELGHTFGLQHARSRPVDGSSVGDDEYGDVTSLMGRGPGGWSLYDKLRLGWVAQVTTPSVTPVVASGSYVIESLSVPPMGGSKGLEIALPSAPNGWKAAYVEYRTQVGRDSNWSGSANLGVALHVSSNPTYTAILLDEDPTSPALVPQLGLNAPVTIGNVTVTVTALTATSATINVGVLPVAINVAAASQGASASASSVYTATGVDFSPAGAINGNRVGAPWGSGQGWTTPAASAAPAWLDVQFAGVRSINRVDVFSVQDNYLAPVTPTPTLPFTLYGCVDFDLSAWVNGAWLLFASIRGNTLVWRTVLFPAVSTDRLRLTVLAVPDHWPRVVEIEASSVIADTSAPVIGSIVAAPQALVSATVTDDTGVAKVEFRLDGTLMVTVTSAPYQAVLPVPALTPGLVEVRAYDTTGNVTAQTIAIK